MDDSKPQLPHGWIVKQSKSYPDRVYYFNVNTNVSSWEFPDLLQAYRKDGPATKLPPVLSATSLHNPSEATLPSTDKQSTKATSSSSKPGPSSKKPSTRVQKPTSRSSQGQKTVTITKQETRHTDKREATCRPHNERTGKRSPVKKRKISPVKYPERDKGGEKDKTTNTPGQKESSVFSRIGKHEAFTRNKLTSREGLFTKKFRGEKINEEEKKTSQSHVSDDTSVEVPSKRRKTNSSTKTVPSSADHDVDQRLVIRSSLQSLSEKRKISVKDAKIRNLSKRPISPDNVDLTVNTSLKSGDSTRVLHDGVDHEASLNADDNDNDQPPDDGDRNNNTHFKVFIGDKDKLLNIQSWINTVDEAAWSDSSSQDCQLFAGLGNVSFDSGYASVPRVSPTERGWPGAFKKPNIKARDLNVLEVDECLVPSYDPETVNQEEEMDIEEVLTEVRDLVKSTSDDGTAKVDYVHSAHHLDSKRTDSVQTIVVVVDTNVLMNNIDMVDDLKDWHIQGCGKPCLYIPWIVLLELDKLKDTIKHGRPFVSLKAQHQARKAINFLKALFADKHPRLMGQTARQADEARTEFMAACNDDRIIQACLQCQKVYPRVVLFTNDNNLVTKCLVMSIPAYTSQDINQGLETVAKGCDTQSVHTPIVQSPIRIAETPPFQSPSQSETSIPVQINQSETDIPVQMSQSEFGSPIATTQPESDIPTQINQANSSVLTEMSQSEFNNPTQIQMNQSESSIRQLLEDNSTAAIRPSDSAPSQVQSDVVKTISRGNTNTVTEGNPDLSPEKQVGAGPKVVKPYTIKALVDDVFCKMKVSLHEAMGRVLEVEMKLAYDDIWLDILYKKPPWSLKDILECWKKHFMAVFGMVLPRSLVHNVQTLLDHFSYTQGHTIETLSRASVSGGQILDACAERNKYGEKVPRLANCVNCLKQLCADLETGELTPGTIHNLEDYLKAKLGTVPAGSLHRTNSSLRGSAPSTPQQIQGLKSGSQTPSSSQNNPVKLPQVPSASPQTAMSAGQQASSSRHKSSTSANKTLSSAKCKMSTDSQQTLLSAANERKVAASSVSVEDCNPNSAINRMDTSTGNNSVGKSSQTLQTQTGSQSLLPSQQQCNVEAGNQSAGETGSDVTMTAAVAGQRLEEIWKFIHKSCEELDGMLQCGRVDGSVETKLQRLVTACMQIRKVYAELLSCPVDQLRFQEPQFVTLTNMCNTFFAELQCQVEGLQQLTPDMFLILYSLPQHRGTLSTFLEQLDEMLRHLYQCIEVLAPDD